MVGIAYGFTSPIPSIVERSNSSMFCCRFCLDLGSVSIAGVGRDLHQVHVSASLPTAMMVKPASQVSDESASSTKALPMWCRGFSVFFSSASRPRRSERWTGSWAGSRIPFGRATTRRGGRGRPGPGGVVWRFFSTCLPTSYPSTN